MSAPTTTTCIDFLDLDDFYIEVGEYADAMPDVFSLEHRGEEWLTDRYWVLPRSLLSLPGNLTVRPLPIESDAATKLREWIDGAMSGDLRPPTSEFAPAFAGIFTLHGLTAYDCGITKGHRLEHAPHVLCRADGSRVGVLMPVREPTVQTSPIPAKRSMLTMYERIASADVVRVSEAWALAAHLTAGRAS